MFNVSHSFAKEQEINKFDASSEAIPLYNLETSTSAVTTAIMTFRTFFAPAITFVSLP